MNNIWHNTRGPNLSINVMEVTETVSTGEE